MLPFVKFWHFHNVVPKRHKKYQIVTDEVVKDAAGAMTLTVGWIAERNQMGSRGYLHHFWNALRLGNKFCVLCVLLQSRLTTPLF